MGSPQYLRNFTSTREKVVLVSFFQNKFYNVVFIFRFFMNFQRQNVTNVTITSLKNFPSKVFETIALKPLNVLAIILYYIFKVNCQIIFAK